MYATLGVQNAGILTAALATGLSVIPFLLFTYGSRLRARSPFAKQLARMDEDAAEEALAARRRREGAAVGGGKGAAVRDETVGGGRNEVLVVEEEKASVGVCGTTGNGVGARQAGEEVRIGRRV